MHFALILHETTRTTQIRTGYVAGSLDAKDLGESFARLHVARLAMLRLGNLHADSWEAPQVALHSLPKFRNLRKLNAAEAALIAMHLHVSEQRKLQCDGLTETA